MNTFPNIIQNDFQNENEKDFQMKLKDFESRIIRIYQTFPEESIIFQEPFVVRKTSDVHERKIALLISRIQDFFANFNSVLSDDCKKQFIVIQSKLEFLRSTWSRRRWWRLKWEAYKTFRKARNEMKQFQEKKWQEFENKHFQNTIRYDDLSEKKKRKLSLPFLNWMKKFFSIIRTLDLPDEQNQEEIFIKQQYESIWIELKKFSGVLIFLYMIFYAAGYYLRQRGFPDHFLVRMYDTALFQQIVLTLFFFYALLTFRILFLPHRIKTDGIIVAIFILLLFWIW